jgi:hypothetical protein
LFTVSETIVASTTLDFEMINSGARSLYDLMETNEEMVLSVVKEQPKHYKIRKVSDEKYKSLLA